jgi:hypothetical protein
VFRPEVKKKVLAEPYGTAPPDDPVLENRSCKGKPIAHLIVWKFE